MKLLHRPQLVNEREAEDTKVIFKLTYQTSDNGNANGIENPISML